MLRPVTQHIALAEITPDCLEVDPDHHFASITHYEGVVVPGLATAVWAFARCGVDRSETEINRGENNQNGREGKER